MRNVVALVVLLGLGSPPVATAQGPAPESPPAVTEEEDLVGEVRAGRSDLPWP